MISATSKHADATVAKQAVEHRRAELAKLSKELDSMASDLKIHPSELKAAREAKAPLMNAAAFNATFLHAKASKAKVTDADLKKQLHVLCGMLSELEQTEAAEKEQGQQEIETLKAEVATLKQEIENCKQEEQASLQAAVSPAAAPPPDIEYDCEAGFPNWKLGWSDAKKTYCCKKEQKGCEFDCDAGFANWKAGWSPAKKEYCCAKVQKGCPEDEKKQDAKEALDAEEKKNGTFNSTGAAKPFDCDAGLSNWEKGWSDAKKEWCCQAESKGCPFDCEAGVDNWENGWSPDKKEFCCEHADVACKFDCAAGFPNWELGWSEEKKEWCCTNKQTETCPGDFQCDSPDAANAEAAWTKEKKEWCCMNKDTPTCKYDCKAGIENWEQGWSEDKKDWCCANKSTPTCDGMYQCDYNLDKWQTDWVQEKKDFCCSRHGTDTCKYDCDAGHDNRELGWSEDKKEWCCKWKGTDSCPEGAEPEANVSSHTEEHASLEYTMPKEEVEEEKSGEVEESEEKPAEEGGEEPAEEPAEEGEEAAPQEAEPQEASGDEEEGESGEPPEPPDSIEPGMPEADSKKVGEWDRPDSSTGVESEGSLDIDADMPYGDLEPFGREDTAQELTESSIKESDEMVDQLERAEVAEEKRAVFRALTRLRGAAITSFDGIARSQTGNIDEYNKKYRWRETHPLHHLADEESDVNKWAFPEDCD
jgi:cell division protein FtsB